MNRLIKNLCNLIIFVLFLNIAGCGQATNSAAGSQLTAFSVNGNSAVITEQNISLVLPYATNTNQLVATFNTSGSKVKVNNVPQISGTTSNNFSSALKYEVAAADGTTTSYTVTVMLAPNDAKSITAYSVDGQAGVITGNTIDVIVPHGTKLNAAHAAFTTDGVTVKIGNIIQTSSIVNDFSKPVNYTVIAADGSTATYQVSVIEAPSSAKEITKYSLLGHEGIIDGNNIIVNVASGTKINALVAKFNSTGVTVTVGDAQQAPTIAQDFSNGPVSYKVFAADGSSETYQVYVKVADDSDNTITAYSVDGFTGDIQAVGPNKYTINLTLPSSTNLSQLRANLTSVGTIVAKNQTQIATQTVNDFSHGPVEYTVTAKNNTTAIYQVSVIQSLKANQVITKFGFEGADGCFDGTNITVTMPATTTNFSNLRAKYTAYANNVKVNGKIQTTGVTPNDFSNPVEYQVYSDDCTMCKPKIYTVVVQNKSDSGNELLDYSLSQGTTKGTTERVGRHINVTFPADTNRKGLIATYKTTGKTVLVDKFPQSSGQPIDFDKINPREYIVVPENGDPVTYTVSVIIAPDTAKEIKTYSINNIPATTIDQDNGIITVKVPQGTLSSNVIATFTTTGENVISNSKIQKSGDTITVINNAIKYEVYSHSDKETPKIYNVLITEGLSSDKEITKFSIGNKDAEIRPNRILLRVPPSQCPDISKAIVKFETTGESVTVKNSKNENIRQQSEETQTDFSRDKTVRYTVWAKDGSHQDYDVNVNIGPNEFKEITSYSINGIMGKLSGDSDIMVNLPASQYNKKELKVDFSYLGNNVQALIDGKNEPQTPGNGTLDFSQGPIKYLVYADACTKCDPKIYMVTVNMLREGKSMDTFAINGVNATIDNKNRTINFPGDLYNVNWKSIAATFTSSPGSKVTFNGVIQSNDTKNNFYDGNPPIIYKVTSEFESNSGSSYINYTDYTVNAKCLFQCKSPPVAPSSTGYYIKYLPDKDPTDYKLWNGHRAALYKSGTTDYSKDFIYLPGKEYALSGDKFSSTNGLIWETDSSVNPLINTNATEFDSLTLTDLDAGKDHYLEDINNSSDIVTKLVNEGRPEMTDNVDGNCGNNGCSSWRSSEYTYYLHHKTKLPIPFRFSVQYRYDSDKYSIRGRAWKFGDIVTVGEYDKHDNNDLKRVFFSGNPAYLLMPKDYWIVYQQGSKLRYCPDHMDCPH